MTTVKFIYGIQDAELISDSLLTVYARHFEIPPADNYSMDTSFATFIHSFDTSLFKQQIQNHCQPLQALYFDKTGRLGKFYINCYAGGFPTIRWNRNGKLNVFPPKDQAPTDTLLSLEKQVTYMTSINCSEPPDFSKYDYTVIIYWNHFMKRHSRHLIKSIRKNCALADRFSIRLIYVNNDNLFAYYEKNTVR